MNSLALVKNQQTIGKVETLPTTSMESAMDVFKLGEVFAQSGLFQNARDMSKAVVQIMAGREMGFGAFASMSNIHIVQGRCVIGATMIAAAIKQSGKYTYRVTTGTVNECEIEIYELVNGKFEPIGVSSYTVEDAENAGLLGKENWKKYPADMLFARAISRAARRFCPDVFGGSPVYVPGEIEESKREVEPPIEQSKQIEPPKQIETQKTIRDVAREVSPMRNEDARVELEVTMLRKQAVAEIFALCKDLKEAGDDSLGSTGKLKDFINEGFEVSDGIDSLDFDSLDTLKTTIEKQIAQVLAPAESAVEQSPDAAF